MDGGRVQVAKGKLWPDNPDYMIHGMKLLSGHKKVNFVKLLSIRHFKLDLPVPSQELKLLGQATGSPVMWPENLIELPGEVFIIIPIFHFDIIRV